MQSAPVPGEQKPVSVQDGDINAVPARCNGDPRAAIRILLIDRRDLAFQLERARKEASWGYVRGRPSRRERDAAEG